MNKWNGSALIPQWTCPINAVPCRSRAPAARTMLEEAAILMVSKSRELFRTAVKTVCRSPMSDVNRKPRRPLRPRYRKVKMMTRPTAISSIRQSTPTRKRTKNRQHRRYLSAPMLSVDKCFRARPRAHQCPELPTALLTRRWLKSS